MMRRKNVPEGWVKVADVGKVAPGGVLQVYVGDEPVALVNVDGEYLATTDVCSHEYVYLSEGWIEGDEIECPQHGSRFNVRTGEVMNLPATQPIATYPVKVENDGIYVSLTEPAPEAHLADPTN